MTTQLDLGFSSVRRPLRIIDLCCGAGMASLGFLRASGYVVDLGVDLWGPAAEVFNVAAGPAYEADVLEIAFDYHDAGPRPDVVIAGPPCQDDSRLGKLHPDQGRGEIKAPALLAARWFRPTWIVMEMVGKGWEGWAREQGARQVLKLRDCDCGGSTIRNRWFAIWGPRDLELRERPATPWNEVLGVTDPGAVLATDANGSRRWRLAKRVGEAAQTVIGHGTSHQLKLSDGTVRRLTPAEEAALQGHAELPLEGLTVRTAQTLVGNGWPASFGQALGEAILRATAGDPDGLPEVPGWDELDIEELAETVHAARYEKQHALDKLRAAVP